MSLTSAVLLFVHFVCIAKGSPYSGDVEDMYNSDYDSTSPSNEVMYTRTPEFISEPMTLLVNEGETVELPCEVDRLQGFVLIWKLQKENEILAVGEQIVSPKVKLENYMNGNNLVLSQVSPEDEGEYTCQISAYNPKYLKHKISVRVKPQIKTVPSELLVVREGDPAALSCQAVKGSPVPSLSWKRKHKSERVLGGEIKWSSVSRHDGGHYICQANNGFGPNPVWKEVKLEVHHAPHVESKDRLLHTTEGEKATIGCTIHCSPRCDIVWAKDGSLLQDSNTNLHIHSLGPDHVLTILKVTREYFGDYSCSAENLIGSKSATVKLSGLALPAEFEDNSLSPWLDKAILTWTVISRAPVQSFSVEYRGEEGFSWRRREVGSEPAGDNVWKGSISIDQLQSASRYEAKVSAKNKFGYSNYSQPFYFATKGADPVQQMSISGAVPLYNAAVTYAILLIYTGDAVLNWLLA